MWINSAGELNQTFLHNAGKQQSGAGIDSPLSEAEPAGGSWRFLHQHNPVVDSSVVVPPHRVTVTDA